MCITVSSNAFPQLQRKTSRLVLLAVYCVFRLYQPDVFSDVSGTVIIMRHCHEININLCLIFGQYFG